MNYTLYECGGAVRDEFLGLQSKDVDYSVILEDIDLPINEAFTKFEEQITSEGYRIFKSTADCFTVRAKFPDNHVHAGLDADFVLARKELGYIKGTRQPEVVLGTLEDDLIRRDFTVNALAKDMEGNIVDLFNGQRDLQNKILRTPTDTAISFNDDPLRILRAVRFSVTKHLEFCDEIWRCIDSFDADKMTVVSAERIREELNKCFKFDTLKTLEYLRLIALSNFSLYIKLLPEGMRLEATMKK